MIDMTHADIVEIQLSTGPDGKPILWVNVNGFCKLRVQRIEQLNISDLRWEDQNG